MKNLHQRDLINFLLSSNRDSFTSNNIADGFSKAGIIPFNTTCVLEACEDWHKDFKIFVPRLDKGAKPLNEFKRFQMNLNITNQTHLSTFI